MSKENYWIKLHSNIIDWEWYSDSNVMRLWIHILLKTNYKDNVYKNIPINKGTHMTSIESLSKGTGLSFSKVRNSLNKLKTTGEITIKTFNKYSIIQVVKWETYQQSTNNLTNKQTSKTASKLTRETTTTKNNKNIAENTEKKGDEFLFSKNPNMNL